MICGTLGIEQRPREDHAQYIKPWLLCLRNDNKFIISAASKALKAAGFDLDNSVNITPPVKEKKREVLPVEVSQKTTPDPLRSLIAQPRSDKPHGRDHFFYLLSISFLPCMHVIC